MARTYLKKLPLVALPLKSTRFVFSLILLISYSCLTWNFSVANAEDINPKHLQFFETSVRPLLVKHCYECHQAGEENGGLALDSREATLKGGDSGPSIVVGQPEKSLLIEAVHYKNLDLQMPPQNRLKPAEIKMLEKWVSIGAPDPRESKVVASSNKPTGMTIEEGRKFWSFMPVSNPAVPEVKKKDWVKTPIDSFILAKLESQKLTPAAPADKRTLLRRVTFDLTGLPPTIEEMNKFLADDSKEAYEKVVDRLLASPDYGIRWGRHWLDVARYADSNGLDENLAYGNAWRYRDYVVNSFNDDKPFDRFLVEQIAGDLLPGANEKTMIATGFLALGAKVLAEPDREKLEMDTIDEQLDTIGKAFLGMTFGCVRCHDHKFDPVKQTDYYSLAAIFKGTKTFGKRQSRGIQKWHENSLASEEELKKFKEINKQIAAKKSAITKFKNKSIADIRTKARSQAAQYLLAAASFGPSMSLNDVIRIAEPLGLHPRILHHCRLHLSFNESDPVFAYWHMFVAMGDRKGLEEHYVDLFSKVEAAVAEKAKTKTKGKGLEDKDLELARQALYDLSGFLAVPPKPEFAFDEKTLAEYYRLSKEARIFESNAADEPSAMGVSDGEIKKELPIHIRGSHRNLGKPVPRAFPIVMRTSEVQPILRANQSGRLELANWMAGTQHPLTARVYVNRIWRWHFGEGIVKSTENFGRLGDRPSHPELLDWLARHFMEQGWSTKQMHRLILLSSTYQMASNSENETSNYAVDPENQLLWKIHLQRLDAEQIRDSILSVTNRLDETKGGKTVPLRNRQFVFNHTSVDHTKYDSVRRAIYLPIIRNNLYPMFEQFDFPDPTMPTGNRNSTVVAPQALLVMNSDLFIDSANAFAKKMIKELPKESDRVVFAYERSLGRKPTKEEVDQVLSFVGEVSSSNTADSEQTENDSKLRAWSLFCQSLFASNEFIYLR